MPDIFAPSSSNSKSDVQVLGHHHLFASFCDRPIGVSFANQQPNETVLLLLRRHLITNVGWITTTVLLLLVPPVLNIFAFPFDTSLPFNLPRQFFTIFIIFYYLAIFAYILINLITWFYNVSLVTTERIVDIDFSDLIYHNVAATKLSLIQDVEYTQVGVIRSLFDYGDVFVKTASGSPDFDFLAVPKPAQVVNIIEDLIGNK